MPDHTDDSDAEPFDIEIRVPGIAFDLGKKGFPRVFVVQKLADSVQDYESGRPDDAKSQAEYISNAITGVSDTDAVFQVVYLKDNPIRSGDFNRPKSRYPVPESRLLPFHADAADPVDDSPTWTAREAVQHDTIERLFDVALALDVGVVPQELFNMLERTGIDRFVVESAREAAKAHYQAHQTDGDDPDESLEETADMSVDDDGGPDMDLDDADESDDNQGGLSDFDPGGPL